eukprot:2753649-Amphidinium_carterae.1
MDVDGHGPNLGAQCRKIRKRIPASMSRDADYLPGLTGRGGIPANTRLLMAVVVGTADDPR